MKTLIQIVAVPAVAASGLLFVSCEVEKVEEGKMPEVEVTEEGRMPKYDVDAPEVDVTTERREIEVPKVEVTPADRDGD